MMQLDCETPRFALHYDSGYGVGFIERKTTGESTLLITGVDMDELRRQLNRVKTNATSTRSRHRPFEEIADAIFGGYFYS